MKRKAKRHDHLKKLYREQLITDQTGGSEIDKSTGVSTGVSTGISAGTSTIVILTAAEQRWLRRDLFKSIFVVLLLLAVIAIIAVQQNSPTIVQLTARLARWGGF